MGAYGVNIIALANKEHQFEFELEEKFFRQFGSEVLSKGSFVANVILDKHETFIEADFDIKGTAHLTCDRSLEEFEHPVEDRHKVVFKFGDVDQELSDEIVMINRDTAVLELGQYMYEFIVLALPMKRLHPKFQQESEDEDEHEEGKIVYTSEDPNQEKKEEEIDPRWNILKKLK
ncbi:YceD family protein [Pseudochryseolinea flava]|uniref:YceD family protein n=1 Tax=Pseudochryseolinea flava TaxID=2059302 RepID=UPI001FE522DD|nr:DUF177 domain-containing protein [Pseudochryseolinea flava]